MSAILFKHLKTKLIQQPIPILASATKKSIWHFFKSQLGLFGEPQKTQTKPANRIPFASQKEKEEHNVGDLKSEGGKQYIFLETTIGKPRWHSHEELVTMAKEGKKIPEIAKKKMTGLEKSIPKEEKQIPKEENKLTPEFIKAEYEKNGLKVDKIVPAKLGDGWFVYHENAFPEKKYKYERKLISEEGNKKTFERTKTPIETKKDFISNEEDGMDLLKMNIVEARNRAGIKQPTDQLSENINKKVVEQGEKEKPSLKTLMTTQAKVLELAEIPEQDIGMYALNSMADGAKLRSYSTEVIKGEMTAEQAAEKVKSDYSKMKEGEKPTNAGELPSEKEPDSIEKAKKDIERAKELMKEAPEKAESNSGIKTKADHQKYIDEVQAWIDKKEKKVQPKASTEQKEPWGIAKENVKPYVNSLQKLTEKELRTEDKKISDAINKWANDTPTIMLDGKLNPKIGHDPAYFDLSEKLAAIGREQESRKQDTLPLLPSEKDSKEGDTKSINGITYELKRGESGELRWHRVTEEEKKKYIAKYSMPNGDVKQTESYDTPGMAAANVEKDAVRYRVESVIPKEKEKIFTVSFIRKEEGAPQEYREVKAKNKNDANKIGQQIAKENDWRFLDVAEGNKEESLKGTVTAEEALGKKSNSITMPRQEAIEEHKNLVNVLENGTEEERKAEAEKQQKELEGYEEGMDENSSQEEPSLKDQVEERLNEKQESKKFKDVGTRVGGSKKEMAAIRVLTADDLSKLDNATAYKVVTKERILPDIDAEAEKANGVESGAAYLKKKFREALMARPLNSAEDRKKYIETIPKVFEKIDACKTIDELRSIGNDYFDIWHSFRSNKVQAFLKGDKNNELSSVLGKEFCNLIARNSDSAKEHWNNAKLMSPMSQEESDERYKQYEEARKNGLEVNKKRMEAYTPEQWENYFKNDPATTFSFNRRQLTALKKDDPAKYQEAIDKHKAREYKFNEQRNEVLPYEKWLSQNPSKAPREANWDWANPKDKKAIQKVKDELQIHDSPPLAFIKRTNGREVKNSDITPEAIKSKYGFASVQFGHYVKDNEAKEHVRHFIESMNDIEDALGIDIKKMNELSGLSIAFGARGGGKALAHYEPMAKIINITKSNGDGSIAHELFHNIDHLLAGMKEGTRKEKIYLSQQQLGGYVRNRENDAIHRTPIHQAMQQVMNAIKDGNYEATANFQPGENKNTYGSIRQMFEDKGYEYTKDYLLHRYSLEPKESGNAIDYFKYLATLSKKPIEIKYDTKQTKFYTGAKSFKSDYWQREPELLARAAEAYVQDKVMGAGMYNNYLVAGNNIQQPDMKYNGESLELTYPQGEERVAINEAFDKLIEAAKEELNIGVDKPKEGKRISSEVQMQKSLYNPSFFETYFRRLR